MLHWQQRLTANWARRGALARLLWPLSLLYGLLVRFRHFLYLSGVLPHQPVAVPMIVVGNVVAGGAGKTPTVIALVKHLQARGFQVGVISRGYGRRTQDCREVLPHSAPQDVGDEPALIRHATNAAVFVAIRRVDAARALLQAHPQAQVLVADDGLQHYALARDIEICVFDDRGAGNGFLLPAGPLREPWPKAVDLVLHTGAHPAFGGYTAQRKLATFALRADGSRVTLTELGRSGHPLLAVAAIARPQVFFDMLQQLGIPLAATMALPDHSDFSDWSMPQDKNHTLICTEKDAVKLWKKHPDALAVALDFQPEPAFYAALDALLEKVIRAKLSSTHGHSPT